MNIKNAFLTGGLATATFALGYLAGSNTSQTNLSNTFSETHTSSESLENKLANAKKNEPNAAEPSKLDYPTTITQVPVNPNTEQPTVPTNPSTVTTYTQPNTDKPVQPVEQPRVDSEQTLEEKLKAEEAKRVADGFLAAIDYPIKLFSDQDMLKPEIRDHVQNVRYNKEGFIRSRSFQSGPVRELAEEYSAPINDQNAMITIEDKNDSQPAYIRFVCKNGLKILLDDPYYLELFGKTFKDGDEVEVMYRTVVEHWDHAQDQCEYKNREWLRKRWVITKEGKPTDKFYPILVNVRAKKK